MGDRKNKIWYILTKEIPVPEFFKKMVLIGIGVAIGMWIITLEDYPISEKKNYEERKILIKIYNEIHPGMLAEAAAYRVMENITPRLIVETDKDGEREKWYISEPILFFQNHWILVIEIKDRTVRCIYFGIGDDLDIRPRGAPLGKGDCSN